MDDKIRSRERGLNNQPPPTAEDFERVLVQAEKLRAERDRLREDLDRRWARRGIVLFTALLLTLAYSYLLFYTPTGTSDATWLIGVPLIAAMAVTALALTTFLSLFSNQRKDIVHELRASEEALYQTIQLLRETEELYSGDWPLLFRAQFEIRLARFEIGPRSEY